MPNLELLNILNSPVHGGRREAFSRRYGLDANKVIDFSANISPLGPPGGAIKAILDAASKISRYPEDDGRLRESAAAYLKVDPNNILPGNGSAELIYLLGSCLRPVRALVISPTFTEYEQAARAAGAKVFRVVLGDDFSLDREAIFARAAGADIIFICNPNNPTGNLFTAAEILEIKKAAPEAVLVIDEAFMDFIPDDTDYSLVRQAAVDDKLVVLRSMGKFFSLAGMRVGFLVTGGGMIEKLKACQVPWNVNSLAGEAAIAALSDEEFVFSSKIKIKSLRDEFAGLLGGIDGISVYPSAANFLLAEVDRPGWDANHLQDRLAARNILIRPASDFVGLSGRHFRLAVRDRADNMVLVDEIKEVLT